jgi:hypothetical protein
MDGGRGLPVMTAWLVHPVTVLAAIVLILNDHVLKAAYPGLVTGKLSDIAGLVLLPPLVGLILAVVVRARAGTPMAITGLAVSGVAFTAVKAAPAGAAAASTVFSAVTGPSVILADPTDLAALPALGIAAWVWSRARQRPASRDTLRRFAVIVVLPTAVLGVVATPAPEYPDTVEVASWRNLVVVGQANAYHHDRRPWKWLVSDQGGTGWRSMSPDESEAFDAARPRPVVDATQACVPDDPAHCYRVVPGHLQVEETTDGRKTWTVSWEVPDGRRYYLARSLERVGNLSANLSSLALAVHPMPGGGHVVVVANGRDGCAVRDSGGSWRRVAFGAYGATEVRPAPLSGEPRLIDRELVLMVLLALLAIHIGAWRATSRVDSGLITIWTIAAVGAGGTLLGVLGLMLGDLAVFPGWLAIVLGIPLTLGSAICALAIVASRKVRAAPWVLLTLLTSLVTAGAWGASFLGWVRGGFSYWQAALLALAAALTGIALSARLGERVRYGDAVVDPPR